MIRYLGEILLIEPNITKIPKAFSGMEHVAQATIEEALNKADIILGLVDHREFMDLQVSNSKKKTIIDTRGMW